MNRIKELAKYYSIKENFDFVNSAKTDSERKHRIAELRKKFDASNFSSVSFNNSGYVEDSSGVTNFLDEGFAAERALADIKRHLIREDLKRTLVGQIQAKNSITLRNRERKLEFEKLLQKNY